MMIIYKVTESKDWGKYETCIESTEKFFEKEEDARTFMKYKAGKYLEESSDLYVVLDVSRHLHLRIGDPDGDNGIYTMFDIDEIIVY